MHSTLTKKTPPFYATLCAILLAGAASATEPPVTEGFVNAKVAEVWQRVTTSTGDAQSPPGQADRNLRIGGEIRVQYPRENAGEPETIVGEVLAFEPERMLALRMKQAPTGFPAQAALDGLWTILYLTPSGEDMTHVRIVELGYSDEPAARAAREFVAGANRRLLDTLARQYWPKCARCAAEQDENVE